MSAAPSKVGTSTSPTMAMAGFQTGASERDARQERTVCAWKRRFKSRLDMVCSWSGQGREG